MMADVGVRAEVEDDETLESDSGDGGCWTRDLGLGVNRLPVGCEGWVLFL
jgi:hypothetical protein